MDEITLISLPIDPAPTFEADVTVELPGTRAQAKLRFEFVHKTRDELNALDLAYLGKHAAPADSDSPAPAPMTDGDLVASIVKRWTVGPVDADQRPVAYTRAALERVLNAYPAAAAAIYNEYQMQLRQVRRKNS